MKGILCFILAVLWNAAPLSGAQEGRGQKNVTLPFELVSTAMFVQASVGHSRPLPFMLDTGAKYAAIDMDLAKSLGLAFGERISVVGGGDNTMTAALLKDSFFSLKGLEGFTQPLFMAISLGELSKSSGHEMAGIIGFDFISRFVVEIDYSNQLMTLHDKNGYVYQGTGDSLPITFNDAGHPQVRAQILDPGGVPVTGSFVIDIGSGAALLLNKPFVDAKHFLQSGQRTLPWLEGRGIGGSMAGSVGRIRGIKLGRFLIEDPITVFMQATIGPFASKDSDGNIGAAILNKFKIILDYERSRIILEPNSRFDEPIEYNRSGLSLVSFGEDFRNIRIRAVADHSPASESGLKPGDVMIEIDGQPVSRHTLAQVRRIIQHAKSCVLTVERGQARIKVTLVPRRLI